jgi:hypothetical protein
VGQAQQYPCQAVDAAGGHRGRVRGTASPIVKNARGEAEQGALGSLQVVVEVGVALQGLRAQVEGVRIDDLQQHRPRKTCLGYCRVKGIGDGVPGGHRIRRERIAPPLQADFAHRRFARDGGGNMRQLARERRKRQQVQAGRQRGKQSSEIAVGLPSARGLQDHLIARARRAGGHVNWPCQ